ncbi:MAG: hypothetical protein IVW57_18715 [Ktedonobacterales bacterium]|nr:hypothetical protein [Ktedonobacterales bacterium]
MSAGETRDDPLVPVPGTFPFRLLSAPDTAYRVPPLADPQLAWLRPTFTALARHSMIRARIAVVRWRHPMLDVEHLLLGIVELVPPDMFAPAVAERAALVTPLEATLLPGTTERLEAIPVTNAVRRVIEMAGEEARERGYPLIGVGPLLLGLTRDADGTASTFLAERGITPASLCANLAPAAFTD